MVTYELVVVHTPQLTEQQHRDKLAELKKVIAKNGGEIRTEEIWGKRRLAYQIGKQREGVYALVQFDAPSVGICLSELERHCKIEETVLRHLVTRAVIGKSKGVMPHPAPGPAAPAAETPESGANAAEASPEGTKAPEVDSSAE